MVERDELYVEKHRHGYIPCRYDEDKVLLRRGLAKEEVRRADRGTLLNAERI